MAKPNPINWQGKTPLDKLHESNEKKEPAERIAPEAFAAMEALLRKHGAKRSTELNEGEPGESVINVEERIKRIIEQPELKEDKLKQAFEEIAKAGDVGLPAIEAFLAQGLDLDFKNYPSTLRRELLKICVKINSPDVEKVLSKALRQTGVAEEVPIIASGLHKISPDKHTEAILDVCKAILNSPPEGFTKEQRSLLEAVLANQPAKSDPKLIARGKTLFKSKICFTCHQTDPAVPVPAGLALKSPAFMFKGDFWGKEREVELDADPSTPAFTSSGKYVKIKFDLPQNEMPQYKY